MINNKERLSPLPEKQECVKATAMHEVCITKYGCGVDKSKTTVSLCTAAPVSLPNFV